MEFVILILPTEEIPELAKPDPIAEPLEQNDEILALTIEMFPTNEEPPSP
jgi:hypothetical protein